MGDVIEKINAVLVILNENSLVNALNNLNFANVNLVAAVMEKGDGKFIGFGDKKNSADFVCLYTKSF